MIQFTFEELHELKRIAFIKKQFELAAKILLFSKQQFPRIEPEKIQIEKLKDSRIKKFKSVLLKNGLINANIRIEGKPVSLDFFKSLF